MQARLHRGWHGAVFRLSANCMCSTSLYPQYCAMIGNIVFANGVPCCRSVHPERKHVYSARRSMQQRWATSRWASSCMLHRC